jgi:CrcB protein
MRAGGPAAFALVALGGAVGGLLRYGLTLARPDDPAAFGWTVWSVNGIGSFALGFLVAGLVASGAPAWVRPLLGTGLLGGFTTFSAVAFTVDRAFAAGSGATGAVYLLASLAIGVIGAAVGVAAGTRWTLLRSETRHHQQSDDGVERAPSAPRQGDAE